MQILSRRLHNYKIHDMRVPVCLFKEPGNSFIRHCDTAQIRTADIATESADLVSRQDVYHRPAYQCLHAVQA